MQNPSDKEGDFEISFNDPPLIVRHTLKAHHHVAIVVPDKGATIINDGHAHLVVVTPGL